MIKTKYKKLLRAFKKGFWKLIKSLAQQCGAVTFDCPTYNSITGFWEFEDKLGNSNLKIVESNCVSPDRIDDVITTDDLGTYDSFRYKISFIVDASITTFYLASGIVDSSDSYTIFINRGENKIYFINTNSVITSFEITAIADNELYFLDIVYDGVDVRLTINNEEYINELSGSFNFKNIVSYRADRYPKQFSNIEIYNENREKVHAFNCSEGSGTIIYNSVDVNKNGNCQNITEDTFHNSCDKIYPNNLINGCDVWINDSDSEKLYVPLKSDGTSIKGSEDTITGYTWSYKVEPCSTRSGGFANVESKLEAYTSTGLLALEAWLNTNGFSYFWTSDGTTLSQKAFSEIPYNHEGSFAILSRQETNLIRDIITMKASSLPLSSDEKFKFEKWLEHIEAVVDENGQSIITSDNGQLYVHTYDSDVESYTN